MNRFPVAPSIATDVIGPLVRVRGAGRVKLVGPDRDPFRRGLVRPESEEPWPEEAGRGLIKGIRVASRGAPHAERKVFLGGKVMRNFFFNRNDFPSAGCWDERVSGGSWERREAGQRTACNPGAALVVSPIISRQETST